jgi:hypothetical protein
MKCPFCAEEIQDAAISREVQVLRFRQAEQNAGKARQDSRARGSGQNLALVAAVGGLGERGHHVKAGLQEAVADGELVVAGELGHALRCPSEQPFHAQGDYRRSRRRSAARRAVWLNASLRWSGPVVVLAVAGGQGFKSSRFKGYAGFVWRKYLALNYGPVLAQRTPTLALPTPGGVGSRLADRRLEAPPS